MYLKDYQPCANIPVRLPIVGLWRLLSAGICRLTGICSRTSRIRPSGSNPGFDQRPVNVIFKILILKLFKFKKANVSLLIVFAKIKKKDWTFPCMSSWMTCFLVVIALCSIPKQKFGFQVLGGQIFTAPNPSYFCLNFMILPIGSANSAAERWTSGMRGMLW